MVLRGRYKWDARRCVCCVHVCRLCAVNPVDFEVRWNKDIGKRASKWRNPSFSIKEWSRCRREQDKEEKRKKTDTLVARFFCVTNLEGIASLVNTPNLIRVLPKNIVSRAIHRIRILSFSCILAAALSTFHREHRKVRVACTTKCIHFCDNQTFFFHFCIQFVPTGWQTMYRFLIKIHASLGACNE